MQSHADLIRDLISKEGKYRGKTNLIHASLASSPQRIEGLQLAVQSLIPQVDTLHVYLNDFNTIPDFLINEKIYITRSQDFGILGECGKYYWVEDIHGYHFICSDRFIYPGNYIETLRNRIEAHHRKILVGCGAYQINKPFISFESSTVHLSESDKRDSDIEVELLKDGSLAFHSDSLRLSRHYFYQPELSLFWLSLLAREQAVPMLCLANTGISLKHSDYNAEPLYDASSIDDYRTYFIKTYFFSLNYKPVGNDINAWFDKIYVMNLDRRTDRWEKVLQRTQRCGIRITRFPAVDGYKEPVKSQFEKYFQSGLSEPPDGIEPIQTFKEKYFKYHHHVSRIEFMERMLGRKAVQSPGALGYALSYVSILKEAIMSNFNRIMIFDDDIILHRNFNEEFQKRMEMLPDDWLLIMLGAMQHHWEPTWITWFNDYLYHCNGSSIASHAVGLHRKAFLPVLYYAQKLDLPIDEGAIYHLQQVHAKKSFIFYPNLAIQDVGESEINSSALSKEDILKKNNLFRWNYEDYVF